MPQSSTLSASCELSSGVNTGSLSIRCTRQQTPAVIRASPPYSPWSHNSEGKPYEWRLQQQLRVCE